MDDRTIALFSGTQSLEISSLEASKAARWDESTLSGDEHHHQPLLALRLLHIDYN